MNQLTPAQMNALLQYASSKLGVPPEHLAHAASSGYEDLLSSLSAENRRTLESMLGNPSQLQLLLQSEQVRQLLGRFTK